MRTQEEYDRALASWEKEELWERKWAKVAQVLLVVIVAPIFAYCAALLAHFPVPVAPWSPLGHVDNPPAQKVVPPAPDADLLRKYAQWERKTGIRPTLPQTSTPESDAGEVAA